MEIACVACGYVDSWQSAPECPRCGLQAPRLRPPADSEPPGPAPLAAFRPAKRRRYQLGPDLDELLGGGLAAGCSVLCGGLPGAGKSSLALQVAGRIARQARGAVLYLSTEMPPELAAETARRVGAELTGVLVWWQPEWADAAAWICRRAPAAVFLDSLHRAPGAAAPAALASLLTACSSVGACAWAIAHSTKDDPIGGPQGLRHDVDLALWIDRTAAGVVVQVEKHRYGPAPQTGPAGII